MDITRKQQAAAQAPIPEGEDRETLLRYYHDMLLIRRFEEKAGEMYTRAKIGGYCHLNLGEEATIIGFCEGLEPDDYVYTNYREHGYAIGRGISPGAVMAELFGKETGASRGRGGSMHLFDINRHFMGGYAIVGGQVPLATGAAFALAYRNAREIVACQMGEGTTNGGAFFESLNLAKIYHLPIVYFVVNNQYGMGLRVEQGSAVAEIYRKACAFDMESWRVDGTDVLAVRDIMRQAAKLARERHEPSLVEAVSFRFRGHSVVDPDRYRDQEQVKTERAANDPITAFAARLQAASLVDEQGLQQIEQQVDSEVDQAVQFADQSPDPPLDTLFNYIYAPSETESATAEGGSNNG
ncbi:MAG TPA: pyruvate dehydrogenase (acetyl-transferring) E1 component subunit alpha [Ktedonobacteraceae bacterium]|nr:pyruvate dehydrogenase (acetyl-transferring) E1 component subunit alpha [Ktedonobacteraceae bacterium]